MTTERAREAWLRRVCQAELAGKINALERANGIGPYAYRMTLPNGGFLYSAVPLDGYEPTPFTEP